MRDQTIDKLIGERLVEIHQPKGITDEDIASAARDLGLPWSRNTVLGIQRGKRSLNVAEFLLLPYVLERALREATGEATPVRLEDLIPDGKVDIGGAWVEGSTLRSLLKGGEFDPTKIITTSRDDLSPRRTRRPEGIELRTARRLFPDDPERVATIERDALGDAENKLARAMGTLPELIVLASMGVWGRTLTRERDRRLAEVDVATQLPEDAEGRKRKLRALRGHTTRALAEEIERPLELWREQLVEQMAPQLGRYEHELVREAGGSIERRLSSLMNTISEIVVLAARSRFGRSATQEFDSRMIARAEATKELRAEVIREMASELKRSMFPIRQSLERRRVPHTLAHIDWS